MKGIAPVRGRFEAMARAHEDFAEYVNDPSAHPITWRYTVETYSGYREEWPGPPTPLYGECVYVYFIAEYEPSMTEEELPWEFVEKPRTEDAKWL